MISLQTQYVKGHDFFHIDIAGNDGTLLKEALKVNEELHNVNYKVLNIDPAKNLCALSEANGIPAVSEFWRYQIGFDHHDSVDLITATNVFAHIDDIEGFLKGVLAALKLKGVLVLEFPYLINFIEGMEFDTVYFEHLSYMSIRPLVELCNKLQLDVIDCRINSIHGGSLQVTICHEMQYKINQNVYDLAHSELNYQSIDTFKNWGTKVQLLINDFGIKILELKKSGAKIGSFAASAKGNTLLNSAGINTDLIDFIADETPEKIGKFSPGTGIPIVNKDEIMRQNPDYIVILSWNFADAIMDKITNMGFEGKFIIPIPEFKVI
jgi:SAM-dependent methyltransferase